MCQHERVRAAVRHQRVVDRRQPRHDQRDPEDPGPQLAGVDDRHPEQHDVARDLGRQRAQLARPLHGRREWTRKRPRRARGRPVAPDALHERHPERLRSPSSAAGGGRIANAPIYQDGPGAVHELQHDVRRRREPDEGDGRARGQGRRLLPEEPEGPERLRQLQRRGTTSTTAPATRTIPSTRSRTRRSASTTRFQQASDYLKPKWRVHQPRVVPPGQLEDERPADARLRRAVLLPDAAVGRVEEGLQLAGRQVRRRPRPSGSTSRPSSTACGSGYDAITGTRR